MHITTQITQANSRLTTATTESKSNILPLHIKNVLLKNEDRAHQDLTHLSAQVTRLVDASGDCV